MAAGDDRTRLSRKRTPTAVLGLALALLVAAGPVLPWLLVGAALAPEVALARGFKSSSFRSSSSRSWSSSRSSYRSSTPRSSPSRSSYQPRPSSSSGSRSSTGSRPWSSGGSRSVPLGRLRGSPVAPIGRFGYGSPGVGYRSRTVLFSSPGAGTAIVVIIIAFVGALVVAGAVVFILVTIKRNERRRREQQGGARLGGGDPALAGPPPGPPAGERDLDPEHAAHWLGMQPGDQVTISDVVAFKDALAIGRGSVHGSDYTVAKVTWARGDGDRDLALALLDDPQQPLLLIVSVQSEAVQLRLLHRPDGAPSGSRADLLDAGAFWLFQPPADADRFRPVDLEWTVEVLQDGVGEDDAGAERKEEVRFERVEVAKLRAASAPQGPDGAQFPLTLVAFRTDAATADPWLMVLESGGAGRDVGGHVEVWQGCDVGLADISVTPA